MLVTVGIVALMAAVPAAVVVVRSRRKAAQGRAGAHQQDPLESAPLRSAADPGSSAVAPGATQYGYGTAAPAVVDVAVGMPAVVEGVQMLGMGQGHRHAGSVGEV